VPRARYSPDTLGPLRQALADKDGSVQANALSELQRANEGGALDSSCQKELFDDLRALLADGPEMNLARRAAGLLIDFDRKRALEFFLDPAVLQPAWISLPDVLEVLATRKIPVPRDRLLTLIGQLEQTPPEHRIAFAVATALQLLGRHRKDEDLPFLEARTKHADSRVANGAARGRLALQGLEDFQEKIDGTEDFAALTLPQKHCQAVFLLDVDVYNGGFTQYFSNPAGEHWREALAGLEAIGLLQHATIFREALAAFGPAGPPDDEMECYEQLDKLAEDNPLHFDGLNTRYCECQPVDVVIMDYVFRNSAAFR
jgi:hypothetical protein